VQLGASASRKGLRLASVDEKASFVNLAFRDCHQRCGVESVERGFDVIASFERLQAAHSGWSSVRPDHVLWVDLED